MKVRELVAFVRDRLKGADLQCADPAFHAHQILQHALGWEATRIYTNSENELSPSDVARVEALVASRLSGAPFQYLTRTEGFWKSQFRVGPGVLIPRKETELLIEAVLARVQGDSVRVAELGAGSGNIGISMLIERPKWEWRGFELNPESLPYTKENVQALLPVGAPYHLHSGDFFQLSPDWAPYDVLVANPPYVSSVEMKTLAIEVRHEPVLALDGGLDGLEVMEKLSSVAPALLNEKGWLFCEIGSSQGVSAVELFSKTLQDVELLRDYAGLPRVIVGRRRIDGRAHH